MPYNGEYDISQKERMANGLSWAFGLSIGTIIAATVSDLVVDVTVANFCAINPECVRTVSMGLKEIAIGIASGTLGGSTSGYIIRNRLNEKLAEFTMPNEG